jgi:hypothetical protein
VLGTSIDPAWSDMDKYRDFNEYLFYEFGYELNVERISSSWPCVFVEIATIVLSGSETKIYEFKELQSSEPYYLVDGRTLTFYPRDNLDIDQFKTFLVGAYWIGHQSPVDLNTSEIGTDVPPTYKRREIILDLCAQHVGSDKMSILEGLFLKKSKQFIALVADSAGTTHLLGTKVKATPVAFPESSAWKRLALGVGKLVQDRVLPEGED